MDSLWKLLYLLEPAPVCLMVTAVLVTYGSAFRALNHGKEMEKNHDLSEASITLNRSQALMIPFMSSFSLLMMFYLFSSVSQLLTAFTAVAAAGSLFFCLAPYAASIRVMLGLADPLVSRCCSKSLTRTHALLLVACAATVGAWLVSGHWILNNVLGISICIAFKIFGSNVMVSVATQQASNPVHTVASSLRLPGLQLITKKLELPVKIVFPRNLLDGAFTGGTATDFTMLGLGDMAIPAMLMALVLCFDHQKSKEMGNTSKVKYIWYALPGYASGLLIALAAGILSNSPQPALLYLVPSTVGPILLTSWIRKELMDLWEGRACNDSKVRSVEV
ncbi:unnamed protein product [Rhodiola kirilowii]